MRVLIDTTIGRRAPLSGTAVYLRELTAALGELDAVEVVEAANERRAGPAGGGLGSLRNLGEDVRWLNVELPRLVAECGADLVHHPLPARSRRLPVPQVVTVHDLAFERHPGDFDRAFRTYAHLAHRAAVRAASAVVAVSQTTAADARELWDVAAERVLVAPLGPGQELPETRSRPPGSGEYFLYVGDAEPRKDLPTLLRAFAAYRAGRLEPVPELVLAGAGHGPGEPSGTGVRAESRPEPARLAELYAHALALVHPARYEGFGLTLLEAMRLGVPVIAARAPGVVETCGEAARLFTPADVVELAARLSEMASDPGLRAELAHRGRRRAAEFSWERCARRHLDAYSEALTR